MPPSGVPVGPRSGQCSRCAGHQSAPSVTTASGSSPCVSALASSNGVGVIACTRRTSHCWYGLSPDTSASPEATAIMGRPKMSTRQSTAWSKSKTWEASLTARNATSRLEAADWMRRSNSSSASAGLGLSLMLPATLGLARRGEHCGADHAGQQAAFALVDARLDLELLAHAVDARIQARDARLEALSGFLDVDGEAVAGAQPGDPARGHEDLRLERGAVDHVDQRLAGGDAFRGLYAQARDVAAERR